MKINRAFMLRWHWRIGLAAALFLIVIAVTGLLLNHARALNLNTIYIDASWILSTYNMELPEGYIKNIKKTQNGITVETLDETLTLETEIEDIEAAIALHYRGEGITLEKLLLDIHTGNILRLPGKILLDLAALAILFLSATGIYNWWKRTRS